MGRAMSKSWSRVGDLSEAKIVAALLDAGHSILRPVGQAYRYDLVIDRGGGKFDRVQCKTGRIKRTGSIYFRTASSGGYGLANRRHYRGEIEYFAVYCPDNEKCYLVPVEELGLTYGLLRVGKAAPNGTGRAAVVYEIRGQHKGADDPCKIVEVGALPTVSTNSGPAH